MAIKSEDLIKYITEQVVTFMETPADVRKENRKVLRGQKEPWKSRWFGMIPFAISMWLEERKTNFTQQPAPGAHSEKNRDKKRTPPST
ncbi:MAG: hypothetical protein K0R67_2229 [Paenibacillus sp.]|nr:hypothetical protein [Paenibacillus sp.]